MKIFNPVFRIHAKMAEKKYICLYFHLYNFNKNLDVVITYIS